MNMDKIMKNFKNQMSNMSDAERNKYLRELYTIGSKRNKEMKEISEETANRLLDELAIIVKNNSIYDDIECIYFTIIDDYIINDIYIYVRIICNKKHIDYKSSNISGIGINVDYITNMSFNDLLYDMYNATIIYDKDGKYEKIRKNNIPKMYDSFDRGYNLVEFSPSLDIKIVRKKGK